MTLNFKTRVFLVNLAAFWLTQQVKCTVDKYANDNNTFNCFNTLVLVLISADGTADEKFEFCFAVLRQYTSKFVFRFPA